MKRVCVVAVVMLLCGLALPGCGDGGKPASTMVENPSGLKYEDLSPGEGKRVTVGDEVLVHYTGWLAENGKQFDSSKGGKPYPVKVGVSSVIKGWHDGLQGMKPGGKRKLYIPSKLAYGPAGQGDIPPNADLVFEVEVVGYKK